MIWFKQHKILTTIIVILAVILIGGIASAPSPQKKTTSNTATKVKPDTSNLDASIKFNDSALQVTNNESKDWNSCIVKLNNSYKYQNATIAYKDSLIIPFSSFTKSDGTKFDSLTTSPKNVYISGCSGMEQRYGYFATNQ